MINYISIIFTILITIAAFASSICNFVKSKKDIQNRITVINRNIQMNNKKFVKNIIFNFEESPQNISLNNICDNIFNYFTHISENNDCMVKVLKIYDNDQVLIIYSTLDCLENTMYSINKNIEFKEIIKNRKQYYYNNNISYLDKIENDNISEYPMNNNDYRSIICYPIEEEKNIVGILSVSMKLPLNDLIDINSMIPYLKCMCILIIKNNLLKIQTSSIELISVKLFYESLEGKVYTRSFDKNVTNNIAVEILIKNNILHEQNLKIAYSLYNGNSRVDGILEDQIDADDILTVRLIIISEILEEMKGQYKMQFWLNDKKIPEVYFTVV